MICYWGQNNNIKNLTISSERGKQLCLLLSVYTAGAVTSLWITVERVEKTRSVRSEMSS